MMSEPSEKAKTVRRRSDSRRKNLRDSFRRIKQDTKDKNKKKKEYEHEQDIDGEFS